MSWSRVCRPPARSHFAGKYLKGGDRKRVNRKEIRRLLYEMTSFGETWNESRFAAVDEFLVKHVERKIIEHLLQNRQKVLVDNSCVSASSREPYVALAAQVHRTARAIFLNTPARACLERNRKRTDPVPETVISNLAAAIELPMARGGFREMLVTKEH